MSAKTMKLLRKGAKKFNLPYKDMKKAYKNLKGEEKEQFLKDARSIV